MFQILPYNRIQQIVFKLYIVRSFVSVKQVPIWESINHFVANVHYLDMAICVDKTKFRISSLQEAIL